MQEPHIVVKGKLDEEVTICIKDLLFRVKDAQMSPKCQWKFNGDELKPGNETEAGSEHYKCKMGNFYTFEFPISKFKTVHVGEYECIISSAKECLVQSTVVSTAVKVFVDYGKCTGMTYNRDT